jgi:hypothetical protein
MNEQSPLMAGSGKLIAINYRPHKFHTASSASGWS